MVERRINPLAEKADDKLKAIAGLIQKLSYRDMQKLSQMIAPNGGDAELAEKLLDVAEIILAKDPLNDLYR
ncbi:hypothetical protein NKH72_21965 [Mesorhizobium sp. M0955]|uniref:hypothetical protein n=1 Tax=Mesorhizobium sp. M0955 TaxID=2957033 RepID=UPI0033374DA8